MSRHLKEDCAFVLRASPDRTPAQVPVVAELDSRIDAGELFEVVNERMALRAKLFDIRESAPLARSRAAGNREGG